MIVPIFRRLGENKRTNQQTNKSKIGTKIEREEKKKKILLQYISHNGKEEAFFFVTRCSCTAIIAVLGYLCVRRADNKQRLGLI